MIDPTTAILEYVRANGPQERSRIGAMPGWLRCAGHPEWADPNSASFPALDALLASGLREIERRETCGRCEGTGSDRPVLVGKVSDGDCSVCLGEGTVPVTYLATPEQGELIESLREGSRTDVGIAMLVVAIGMDAVPGDAGQALDTLLASNWITSTEQERECERCDGWGGATGSPVYDPLPCPACKDGRVTVVVYELAR